MRVEHDHDSIVENCRFIVAEGSNEGRGLEIVFNYPGVGSLIIRAIQRADYPVLRAGVLIVAIIYMLATLTADLVIAWMNPRARLTLGDD